MLTKTKEKSLKKNEKQTNMVWVHGGPSTPSMVFEKTGLTDRRMM